MDQPTYQTKKTQVTAYFISILMGLALGACGGVLIWLGFSTFFSLGNIDEYYKSEYLSEWILIISIVFFALCVAGAGFYVAKGLPEFQFDPKNVFRGKGWLTIAFYFVGTLSLMQIFSLFKPRHLSKHKLEMKKRSHQQPNALKVQPMNSSEEVLWADLKAAYVKQGMSPDDANKTADHIRESIPTNLSGAQRISLVESLLSKMKEKNKNESH